VATIAKVAGILVNALSRGNKILLFGNGGSAAEAQHLAAELVGRFAFDRPALPALALSVNPSCVTAIGNDYGFDQVFARQIEAQGTWPSGSPPTKFLRIRRSARRAP
jgi:D-sedoheptulose 7-phosphate isomerase